MLTFLALAVLVAAVGSASVERRALTSIDDFTMQSFTTLFRQTLLNKVAVEWNVTVDQTKQLETMMGPCKASINTATTACKSCAQSQCQTDPTFLDYLNLANPFTYLKGPLNDMANTVGDVVDLLGDKSMGFLNSIGDLAKSGVNGVADGLTSAFNAVKDSVDKVASAFTDVGSSVIDTGALVGTGITDVGSSIGHGLTDVGNTIGDGLTDAGHAIGNIGGSIVHGIGGIFGKREIDPQARACMEQCASCKPLLLNNQQKTITAICGAGVTNLNNTIQSRVKLIKGVYDASINKAHPIIKQLEFDPTSMNSQMQFTRVFITAYMNGGYVRYQSKVNYGMMTLPQTALDMALEYWSMYAQQ